MENFFKHFDTFIWWVITICLTFWALPYLMPLFLEIREEYTFLGFIWAVMVGIAIAFWDDPLQAALVVFVIFPVIGYMIYGYIKYLLLGYEP